MKHTAAPCPASLIDATVSGYYWCKSCCHVASPIEDDHGQPPQCNHCGGKYLKWNPPIFEPEKAKLSSIEAERCRLDAAVDCCNVKLREAIEYPCAANLDALTRAVAQAHGALSDLSEAEKAELSSQRKTLSEKN